MKCADISIRNKIIATNSIALILLVILAGFVWHALGVLDEEGDTMLQAVDLQNELILRENDHLKWVQQLADFANNPNTAKLELQEDPTQCAFGKWYYSKGREQAVGIYPELKNILDKIDQPHRMLHASAQLVASMKEKGDVAAMQQLLISDVRNYLKDISINLLSARSALKKEIEEHDSQYHRSQKSAYTAVIAITASSLLLGLLASLLVGRSITVPLLELVRFSNDVASGNTDADLEIDCRNELGDLAQSLRATVRHMNDQLAYSKGILSGLTVPCSVFSNDDTTVFTNTLMLDLLERSGRPEEYYGQKSGLYIWGDANRETLSTVALREKRMLTAEREITAHKGTKRHVSISSAPFRNEAGDILGTLSIWVDMTDIVTKNELVEAQNKEIMNVANKLQDVVGIVSSASEQLSAQVEQSSRGAQIQAQRMAETATAMEEMTATVIEVARNASEAANTTEQARKKAQHGAQVVDTVVRGIQAVQVQALGLKEEMSALGGQADGIGRIINVISDIADQTNLLALNAAIEAARAGDAGRGFAVVADEVRKLAEKTMTATQEVDSAIRAIQQGTQKNVEHVDKAAASIEDATRLANDSGTALHEIVRLVDVASDQVRAIATASEEQSSTSEEINRSVDDVNRVASETAQAMDQASHAVIDLARQAQILNSLSKQMVRESA